MISASSVAGPYYLAASVCGAHVAGVAGSPSAPRRLVTLVAPGWSAYLYMLLTRPTLGPIDRSATLCPDFFTTQVTAHSHPISKISSSMPLVRIDVIREAWSANELKNLADVIQQVMLDHFNAPNRDRYQVRWWYTWPFDSSHYIQSCQIRAPHISFRSLPNTKIMSSFVRTPTWATLELKRSWSFRSCSKDGMRSKSSRSLKHCLKVCGKSAPSLVKIWSLAALKTLMQTGVLGWVSHSSWLGRCEGLMEVECYLLNSEELRYSTHRDR